jgi:hypothetical protein
MLDGNIEVVVLEEEKAIMDDMGPETLKNVLADATVSTMKLMKISNFFNGRERHFVKERAEAAKKLKKKDDELKKAHADLRELDVSFEAYRDKYELHLTLTKTLEEKEQEEDQLAKDKKELVARVTELEGQLQKLTIPDEEEKNEDPSGEFTNTSPGALIKQVIDVESSAVDMATSMVLCSPYNTFGVMLAKFCNDIIQSLWLLLTYLIFCTLIDFLFWAFYLLACLCMHDFMNLRLLITA